MRQAGGENGRINAFLTCCLGAFYATSIISSMSNIKRFETSTGRLIYTFPVQSFPGLVNNIHIITDGEQRILVDCGSGTPQANDDLLAGITAVSEHHDPSITLDNLDTILITHGHIDHFGGLPFVRQYTNAPVGIHVLDRRVLSNHEERVVFASNRLEIFLEESGVSAKHRQELMQVYLFSKNYYRSFPVQFLLEEGIPTVGEIGVYHVPGHCPGQVCLMVDDIMLTADHILSRITPHQAPESITNNMGLGHYLNSLTKIEQVGGIRLALGGHEEPMGDVYGRIRAIKQSHDKRLNKILDICTTPKSIADISRDLFGRVGSYHILLALEETGAHVEYLYQRGELIAANLDEIETTSHPVVQYIRA
ncbi:MAG: MBL fold metallo-hydrolase [Anaerolineales bacterium]|nr:MBL fold metallo-hydrolase [Anaerolineales bacterium]